MVDIETANVTPVGNWDMTGGDVKVPAPSVDTDASTKKYVDDNAGGAPEGTAVLSTGETGATLFLREDGDGTCSWQNAAGGGIRLDEVNNPNTDKDFSMGNNELMFSFTGPTGVNGAFGIEASAGFSGDLVHIHQHTGNPTADLVHLEAEGTNITPLRIISAGGDIIITGADIVTDGLVDGIDVGVDVAANTTDSHASGSDDQDISGIGTNTTAIALNTTHRGLTDDPHSVTASQVGLGNVDNVGTDDTAYNATSWNTNTDSATKNAIRDKIETMDTAIGSNTSASHAESHNIASHSDTTATGAELDTLTSGGDTTLHDHDGISENTTNRHASGSDDQDISGIGDNATAIAFNTTHRGSAGGTDHSDVSNNNDKVSFTKDNLAGKVIHGSTAATARPSGFVNIEWIGDVEPTNAINNDEWTDTT